MNAAVFVILAYIAGVTTVLHVSGHDETVAQYLHVAHVPGAEELAVFAAALFGAGIGFLWYNAYPAQVFMGDVGALSLGGSIGMIAVLTKNELVLVVSGGLFVVETPAMYAKIRNVPAFMIVGPIARPSRPSVRLTALAVPTTTSAANAAYSQGGRIRPCS